MPKVVDYRMFGVFSYPIEGTDHRYWHSFCGSIAVDEETGMFNGSCDDEYGFSSIEQGVFDREAKSIFFSKIYIDPKDHSQRCFEYEVSYGGEDTGYYGLIGTYSGSYSGKVYCSIVKIPGKSLKEGEVL